MADLMCELGDDRKTVTVTFPSSPPVALRLNVKKLEAMLHQLGNCRRLLKPEVPQNWRSKLGGSGFFGLRWMIDPRQNPFFRRTPVRFRDPRFGWVEFFLTKAEARELGEALLQMADAPDPLASRITGVREAAMLAKLLDDADKLQAGRAGEEGESSSNSPAIKRQARTPKSRGG